MPFPLIKLGYLVVKQISKPLANVIKSKAKTTPFLRNKILLPPAQLYHKIDTTIKMKLLGIGKVSIVKPLNEDIAVDLAAEMLGEFVIFSIAASLLFAEYKRQQYKDQNKEDMQNQRLQTLESEVEKLRSTLEEYALWFEKVASHLKIPSPVGHPAGNKEIAQNTENTSSVNPLSNESPKVPLQIKDNKSQIVLQVHK